MTSKGFAWVALAGIAAYQTSLFVLTMVLGHAHLLHQAPFRAGILALTIGTVLLSLRAVPTLARAVIAMRYRPRWIDLLIAPMVVLGALSLYFQCVEDFSKGPDHFDSLGYHITRALLWFDQGSFTAWRTANWHHIGLPLGGDAELQPSIFMGCGWLGAAWTGTIDTVGAAIAIFVILGAYGVTARAALIGSLAFLSFPTVGLRVNEVNTDMAAAFPVLAGAALFLTAQSKSRGLFVFITLVGLGVAAKAYVLFAAIPISLALFGPRLMSLWRTPYVVHASVAGGIVAAIFFLMSYMPVYDAFGNFYGGESGQRLSSYGRPIKEIAMTTAANTLTWTFEPLMVVPAEKREAVFRSLKMKELYEYFGLSERWFPQHHSGENRSGIFPLILLPWLIMAVRRGYRIQTLVLFVLVFCSVTSPMSINLGAPRFALLASALFAILWGARAARSPYLVALLTLASIWIWFDYLVQHGTTKWVPAYSEEIEPYRNVGKVLDGQPVLIFSRGLSTDAMAAGRLGKWRFAYIDCPPEGMSYRDWLISLKTRSRWIGVDLDIPDARYGPLFKSNLGPSCPSITNTALRSELEGAGWKYFANVSYTEQVWRAE